MVGNVRSYTQGGIFTTKLPAKNCISIYYVPFNKSPKPDLRIAVVVVDISCSPRVLNFQFKANARPELLFLRMINCPVALCRAKKKPAYCTHRQTSDSSALSKGKKKLRELLLFRQCQALQRTDAQN